MSPKPTDGITWKHNDSAWNSFYSSIEVPVTQTDCWPEEAFDFFHYDGDMWLWTI